MEEDKTNNIKMNIQISSLDKLQKKKIKVDLHLTIQLKMLF